MDTPGTENKPYQGILSERNYSKISIYGLSNRDVFAHFLMGCTAETYVAEATALQIFYLWGRNPAIRNGKAQLCYSRYAVRYIKKFIFSLAPGIILTNTTGDVNA